MNENSNRPKNSADALQTRVDQLRLLGLPSMELVDALNDLAYAFQECDRMRCRLLSEEALSLAILLKYSEGECRTHSRLGWTSYLEGQLDVALRHGIYAEALANVTTNTRLRLGALFVTANVHQRVGNISFALRDWYTILHLSMQAQDTEYEADTYTSLGTLYREVGSYKEAIDSHKQALRRYGILSDPREAWAYNNLAFAYACSGDGVQAIMHARMAMDKCPQDWIRLRVTIHETMGRACLLTGSPNIALAQYDTGIKAYQMARMLGQIHADSIIATLYQGSALVQRKLGNLGQAATNLDMALIEAERAQDAPLQAEIHGDLAGVVPAGRQGHGSPPSGQSDEYEE